MKTPTKMKAKSQSDEQDPAELESPLLNSNETEQQVDDESPFFATAEEDDDSLPPPSIEEPVETRRSIFSALDHDELQESDFGDAGKDESKTPADVARIMNEIKTVVLFSNFAEDELRVVTDYMYTKEVSAGDVVIERGAAGDAFFVVKRGSFAATIPYENNPEKMLTVREYEGKGYFGELALVNQKPRAATITAITDGAVWVLSALRYSWLRRRRAMSNADRFERLIKSIPLFHSHLRPGLANQLIDAIEVVSFQPGEVICRQGEPGDAMYFVMEGEVEATINKIRVKKIAKNQFFGERALIREEGRAATCTALVKSKVAKLSKESFQLLIPDDVIEKMKLYIVAYEAQSVSEDGMSDDVTGSTTASVYMEYHCQELRK